MAMEKQPQTVAATVEVANWVTKLVGGDGAGTKLFDEAIEPGETVGDLLRRFSRRFPELDAALWEPGRKVLGGHIELLVNDAVLGVSHDLDSRLVGGERITLLGQFMGGSQGAENGPSAGVRRPRPPAQRTESTPRGRPSGAASHLDRSRRPGKVTDGA